MLSPDDLEGIANDVTRIYEDVQSECIKSIVDHITAGKRVTQASVWQMKKLNDVGLLKRDLYKWVAKKSGEKATEVERLVETALSHSLGVDVQKIRSSLSKYNNVTMDELKEQMKQSAYFKQILKNTTAGCKDILNLTNTKAIQASVKAYTDAVNVAYLEMATGNYTFEQAVERAVGRIGKSGIKIVDSKDKATGNQIVEKNGTRFTTYASGNGVRVYPLDSAIRRDLTTTINQSCAKLTIDSCEDMGTELVETSWHVGARPEHEVWQGKIFSLNPKDTRYPYFKAPQEAGGCGYGDMLGICGINCYHSFNPYFEGSPRSTQQGKPTAEENAKAYKEQQTQRAYERSLRALKREQLAYQQGGFTEKAQDAQRRVNDMSARYKKFLNETGRTRVSMLDSITGYRRMNVPVLPAPKTASAYKVITSKARTPVTFQPFGIVDMHKGNNGKYVSRLYYDSTGRIFKEISNGGHGEKVYNGYGKNGEHAHDWVWKDGAVVSRKARELTPRERKECEDILNQK